MIVTTSWDDGDMLDDRVADLLDRHGLRGTFYITRNHRPKTLPHHRIRAIAERHEIGAHTLNHPDLTLLHRRDKREEIEGSKNWLEDVTGDAVPMFCYPFGRFDAEIKRLVAEAGFVGARTTRQFVLAAEFDRFMMATTLQVYPALLRRCSLSDFAKFLINWPQDWADWRGHTTILRSNRTGWSRFGTSILERTQESSRSLFHLWGHSWEINQFGMWQELDGFLRLLGKFARWAETNGSMIAKLPDSQS